MHGGKDIVVDKEILRTKAQPLQRADIDAPETQTLIADMERALAKEEDGVALAAPQLGASLRLFIVAGKVLGQEKPRAFINPVIVKRSRKKQEMEEGCLSLRWLYGKVKRSARVTVEAYDEKGNKFTRGAGGLLAQIFQHEIDHLDGILFTDTATDIIDIPPPPKQK